VSEFAVVFGAMLPVVGLMAVGFALRRLAWLTAEADTSLLRLTVNVLMPALIFETVVGNEALRRPSNLLLPPVVGAVTLTAGIGLAWAAAGFAGLTEGRVRRTFAFTTGIHNYAYIPLPLCLTLFDSGTVGVLLVHNVGAEAVLWTLGVRVLSGKRASVGWRHLMNPPIAAMALAVPLNLAGAFSRLPAGCHVVTSVLATMVHWLGQSAIPVALLLIGAIVADHLPEMVGGRTARVVAMAIVVRLVLMPLLFVLLARGLPCSVELKRVIVVQGAMACAVLPIALTKHYEGDPRTALQVVLGTTLAGLVTIPLSIHFLGKLSGL
jgi:predicted permease